MQRRKPSETQQNPKEINTEKKIITRAIKNYNLEQNYSNMVSYPSHQINTENKSIGGQIGKEIQNVSNFSLPI